MSSRSPRRCARIPRLREKRASCCRSTIPELPDWWDMIKAAMSVPGLRQQVRKDQNRCSQPRAEGHSRRPRPLSPVLSSWHGPHTHDLPFEQIIGLMLQVKAQCYSFEAANARHEHEWRLWESTKLPDGKIILPGVVSHSTNLIEHPDLVADRILRFTPRCVGRENVLAGTTSPGPRCIPSLRAKLGALAEGALASKKL